MKPRVAVILSGYGRVRRGAETMLEQLLPRLENRFDFELYSMSGEGPGGRRKPAVPRSDFEPIYAATSLGKKIFDTLYFDPLHVEWTSHLVRSLPELIRRRYDVIWHETGLWGGRILALVRRWSGVRLLDVAHSSYPGWEIPFARCRPDAYVTADPRLAELVREAVPDLRIEIVPQSVDTVQFVAEGDRYPLHLEPPIALVPGALATEKNPALAVRAAAQAGASVVAAGSGPLAAEIDALAAELLGPDRYARIAVERAEMPSLYRAADVVLLASPLESGALVVLESMACGRPVVTTADPVRREIVQQAGELVIDGTVDDFASAIRRALAKDWGDEPRRRALQFSVDRAAERFASILSSLAAERR